jgi:hypothetical protein
MDAAASAQNEASVLIIGPNATAGMRVNASRLGRQRAAHPS